MTKQATSVGCFHDQLIQTVAIRWNLMLGPACIVADMLEHGTSMYVVLLAVTCVSEHFETVLLSYCRICRTTSVAHYVPFVLGQNVEFV